jgi:hypothetical protein
MNQKSAIRLVKVTDLSKEDINRFKIAAQSHGLVKNDLKSPSQFVHDALQNAHEPLKPFKQDTQVQKSNKKDNFLVNA